MPDAGFPPAFLWGASTSAFQVEGAHLTGGKGLSVADVTAAAHADQYADTSVAAGFYEHYESDIALMAELGLKAYRMSINWTRLFPQGDELEANPAGVDFYHRVFDALERHGIEPIVTLYHFDMPYELLVRHRGWESRDTIEHFLRYAEVCFAEFGGRVRYWLTINEQNLLMRKDKMLGLSDAGADKEQRRHQLNHHMFLANARAIALCHEMCPGSKIGPTIAWLPSYPRTCRPEDVMAAWDADALFNTYATDVYIRGAYPGWYQQYLEQHGWQLETEESDAEQLRAGRPDFLGLNYYLTFAAEACPADVEPSYNSILKVVVPGRFRIVDNPYLEATEYGWQIDPMGFRKSLLDLHDRYQLPLMITENGIGTADTVAEDGGVHDQYRSDYLTAHIHELREAIMAGVEVISYNVWSFLDVVSTSSGFSKRYGLVYVDRDEKNIRQLRRIKKDSFEVYRQVIAANGEGV